MEDFPKDGPVLPPPWEYTFFSRVTKLLEAKVKALVALVITVSAQGMMSLISLDSVNTSQLNSGSGLGNAEKNGTFKSTLRKGPPIPKEEDHLCGVCKKIEFYF